jgi:hypothetical protein
MVIIENVGVAFIHIPKTAGTSIVKWMQDNCNGQLLLSPHAGINQLKERNVVLPKDTQFFTVVRNPFARQLSHYRYHLEMFKHTVRENEEKKIIDPRAIRILGELAKGFEHWFLSEQEFVRPEPRWWNYKWTNQCEWIDVANTHVIDVANTHVMKFANLQNDIQWLFDKTQCYAQLPMENVSGSYKEDYRDHYSQRLRKIVEERHQQDLVLFDYKF